MGMICRESSNYKDLPIGTIGLVADVLRGETAFCFWIVQKQTALLWPHSTATVEDGPFKQDTEGVWYRLVKLYSNGELDSTVLGSSIKSIRWYVPVEGDTITYAVRI